MRNLTKAQIARGKFAIAYQILADSIGDESAPTWERNLAEAAEWFLLNWDTVSAVLFDENGERVQRVAPEWRDAKELLRWLSFVEQVPSAENNHEGLAIEFPWVVEVGRTLRGGVNLSLDSLATLYEILSWQKATGGLNKAQAGMFREVCGEIRRAARAMTTDAPGNERQRLQHTAGRKARRMLQDELGLTEGEVMLLVVRQLGSPLELILQELPEDKPAKHRTNQNGKANGSRNRKPSGKRNGNAGGNRNGTRNRKAKPRHQAQQAKPATARETVNA